MPERSPPAPRLSFVASVCARGLTIISNPGYFYSSVDGFARTAAAAASRIREYWLAYWRESARALREVEKVVYEVRRVRVGRSQVSEIPVLFHEPNDASELVLIVRNVSRLCIGRDGDQRNAETQIRRIVAFPGGGTLIVPSAPVVPDESESPSYSTPGFGRSH